MAPFLDSRHLRLIAEVARTESVTRAADRLHVTQSAVSHQLREIEHRLGAPLFVRSGRRMLPTPVGRLLLDAAGGVLDTIARVEARVAQLARSQASELRVAAHCYTGYHWLPGIVEGLRRRYPDCDVQILPEHTADPIAAVLDARIDLAIMNADADDRRLDCRALFDDEHVVVVPQSHPWAARAFVTPEMLAGEQLYLYSRSLEDSFVIQQVLRPAGLVARRATYLQLTEGILEMVKAGLGVSVLPTWSIAGALRAGTVTAVRIGRTGVFRQWYAATLHGAPLTPFVEEFLTLLVKQGPAARRPARGPRALRRLAS